MHELAITQSIVDVVSERVGDSRVSTVHLKVGQLSGVVPRAVQFCFELVTDGTPLQGAELLIEELPGVGYCHDCAMDISLPDLILLCPCGSANVRVVSGRELTVESIEVA
jgi:hydrogenase nickel incorporation protein HypA/HybF